MSTVITAAPLAGRVAIVTGASSGIGEATAFRLADDGHRLFLGARRTERLEAVVERIQTGGGTASYRRLDVTDAADVQQFVTDATDTYGGVDVMINNAGVMPLSALAENKVDEWNRMIDACQSFGSGSQLLGALLAAHDADRGDLVIIGNSGE
jgi:NADP-dependent 3-hydroxy acid dehydrogenase YdfG